jgi:DNA mismatch endonuclease (patch repair protein)
MGKFPLIAGRCGKSMTDTSTPEQRSATMRAVRGKNTGPEWAVRRLVHRLGYRYRLHVRELPGCPDLVFPIRRKVIFVNGCFWHGHACRRGAREPKSNRDYWLPKLRRNKTRDAANRAALTARGWNAMIIWECETSAPDALIPRLREFLGEAGRTQAPKN